MFYANLKSRTLLNLKKLIGEDVDKNKEKLLEDFFYRLMLPKNYFGSDGMGIRYDKDFEDTCIIMSQYISHNPKHMTTLEYFQTLERLKKQNSPNGR